jgi:Uncharacterized conserved protein (COG2071)
VQASLRVRDLLIASWETGEDDLRAVLPRELEPTPLGGRFLVSLVAFRVEGGRAGRYPVPPYSQLNVRAYVSREGEPAVFFVASRVTAGGLPAVLLGAPFRYGRVRVREGSVSAPGRGVGIRYRPAEPTDPGIFGEHELGLFENEGLRELRIERGETAWQRAELLEPARADFLVALGFQLHDEPELLFAARSAFGFEVPSRRKSG